MSPFLTFAVLLFWSVCWQLWVGYVGGSRVRGFSTPIRSRELRPMEFWSYLAIEILVGLLLVALGIRRYFKILHATDR